MLNISLRGDFEEHPHCFYDLQTVIMSLMGFSLVMIWAKRKRITVIKQNYERRMGTLSISHPQVNGQCRSCHGAVEDGTFQ